MKLKYSVPLHFFLAHFDLQFEKIPLTTVLAIHTKSGKSGGDGYFGQQKLAEKVRKS